MTLTELETQVLQNIQKGHEHMTITVRRRSKPRNLDRVHIVPGVSGRCVGQMPDGRYAIEAKTEALLKALEKAGM